jgi:hypothetical protein
MDAVEKEILKIRESFAKIDGFLNAALSEISPSYSVHGTIEGMLVYQKPIDPVLAKEARRIRDQLHNTEVAIRKEIHSLVDARDEMIEIYKKDILHGKDFK